MADRELDNAINRLFGGDDVGDSDTELDEAIDRLFIQGPPEPTPEQQAQAEAATQAAAISPAPPAVAEEEPGFLKRMFQGLPERQPREGSLREAEEEFREGQVTRAGELVGPVVERGKEAIAEGIDEPFSPLSQFVIRSAARFSDPGAFAGVEEITPRETLREVEPVAAALEASFEFIRRGVDKFTNLVQAVGEDGEVQLAAINDLFNPLEQGKDLVDTLSKIPKEGVLFRELTAEEGIDEKDRFTDFKEVLVRMGVSDEETITIGNIGTFSPAGIIGFNLEVFGQGKFFQAFTKSQRKGFETIIKKGGKATLDEAAELKQGLSAFDDVMEVVEQERQALQGIGARGRAAREQTLQPSGVGNIPEPEVVPINGRAVEATVKAEDDAFKSIGDELEAALTPIKKPTRTKPKVPAAARRPTPEAIKPAKPTKAPPPAKEKLKTPENSADIDVNNSVKTKDLDSRKVPISVAPAVDTSTSLKNASMVKDREEILGISGRLQTPETKKLTDSRRIAIEKGLDDKDKVLELVDQVEKGKILNDEEAAGLLERIAVVKQQHRSLRNEILETTNDVDKEILINSRLRTEQEFNRLFAANDIGGTDASRALGIRRLQINDDFDTLSVLAEARIAKGKKDLTALERAEFESSTAKIEKKDIELQDALARKDKETADAILSKESKVLKKTPAERQADIKRLTEEAKRLIKEGCPV